MTQTASLLEVLCMAVNIVGLLAAGWMFFLTARRHHAVLKTGGSAKGPRVLVAMRHYRCEIGRMTYHVTTIFIGGWAMTLPDPTSTYGHVVVWSRVLFAVMFTAASLMDISSDGRLANLLNDTRQGERGGAR